MFQVAQVLPQEAGDDQPKEDAVQVGQAVVDRHGAIGAVAGEEAQETQFVVQHAQFHPIQEDGRCKMPREVVVNGLWGGRRRGSWEA